MWGRLVCLEFYVVLCFYVLFFVWMFDELYFGDEVGCID